MAGFRLGAEGPREYDCWTFARELLRRAGVELPAWQSVADVAARDFVIEQCKQESFERLDRAEPLCIVIFRLRYPLATHIGVVLDDGQRFIHIMEKRGVAVERLDNLAWSKRIDGFYRYTGN